MCPSVSAHGSTSSTSRGACDQLILSLVTHRTGLPSPPPSFPGQDLDFDVPFPELGFQGVPHKTQSWVLPTVHCLVELIETPFFVISLKDIEVVNLERVGFGLKNFDMAIVFKDFGREVHKITSIDMKYLDSLKEWMTRIKIKYYESKMNLNWKPILKTILDDPEQFVQTGGWDFLNLDQTDSDEEAEEEEEGALRACASVACR